MSHSSQNPNLPNKVIDLLVSDIFNKNNINVAKAKRNISNEQKEMLKELVEDLSQQVDQFLKTTNESNQPQPPETETNNISNNKTRKIRFKK